MLIDSSVVKAHGCALSADGANPKRIDRMTIQFTSLDGDQAISRGEVEWKRAAGKKAEGENPAWDFSMLKPEWLGKSFVMDWQGNYWYTIVGLNLDAKDPVQVICNDSANTYSHTFIYKLSQLQVSELMGKTEKEFSKLPQELKDRRPGAVKKAA